MKPQHVLFLLFVVVTSICVSQIPQIDVTHYKIELEVSDLSDTVRVREQIEFDWTNTNAGVVFNLCSKDGMGKGMVIEKVKLKGKKISFRHENDSLYLENAGVKEKENRLNIQFKGIPKDGLIIGKNKYGDRTFFADNWPTRAQNWFACNDHLSDKATVEFIVHAPKHYEVVANGKLLSVKTNKKIQLHHFSSQIPLPTKVMVVGIADLNTEEATLVKGVPVASWVYPQHHKKTFYDLALAPSILEFYIDYIAPYEYPKLDNVQSTTRFGGMENAGCIFYDEGAFDGTRSSENLIAHEIVHQWFGNSATEKDWCHLWLSEGFATYLTNVYIEQVKGKNAFQKQLIQDRKRIIAFANRYDHPVVDTAYANLMNLLNPNSYQKGGWVLHMLRNEIGDENFHSSIREYYTTYRLSNADTRDFQKVVEKVCERDLDWFFEQWLYSSGHPQLSIESETHENILSLVINQNNRLFTFALPVKIHFTDGTSATEVIKVNDQQIRYRNSYTKDIDQFEIDPEVQLLYEEVD